VLYTHGLMPIYQHDKEDIRSFRMFTSQLIDMGSARQGDIVKTFGVPLSTVKRYLKLMRERGPEAFFAEPIVRSASVLNGAVLENVESLLREGRSVPEVAQVTGIMANTLHKAIRAGRLPAVKKNFCSEHSRRPRDCDKEIEKLVAAFEPKADPKEKPMPEDRKQKQRRRRKKSGSPEFDMRTEAYKLFGVDLTQIPGLMMLVFMLFSEVGRDMSRWPTAGHFVSWLGLCPDNDISGGKVLRPACFAAHRRFIASARRIQNYSFEAVLQRRADRRFHHGLIPLLRHRP